MSGEIQARMDRLRRDCRNAITHDATDNASTLAARYGLEPEFVSQMLPRTYMQVAIEIELQKAGCTDDVIDACVHHVWMLVNGVKEYSGNNSRTQ